MVFQGVHEYMIQLPIRVLAAAFVKILSRRDGAFGLAKCTVRVSTSGLYDFPPKPYKLDLIFFCDFCDIPKNGETVITVKFVMHLLLGRNY